MREQEQQQGKTTGDLRLWTYAEAARALPYLRAVVRSLRDHWLEIQQARREIQRMDARPGRPNREALLLREEARREAELGEERFEDTLDELTALDVFCHDPAKGLVLVPFHEGDGVAWFVVDLFAPQGQELSRFQVNPLEDGQPLVEELDPSLVDEFFSSGISMSGPERA